MCCLLQSYGASARLLLTESMTPEMLLLAQVSTHNLERVRRIKNRMVRLNTRVETIHELLEKLLDDDDDMKDLNLTAKQLVGPHQLAHHITAKSTTALSMHGMTAR